VKIRSHRLVGIALRAVPIAALALLLEPGMLVLAEGPKLL
jgi:hypothetical protein